MTPMKWFLSFLKKYRGYMALGIVMTTAVSVLSVVNPYISGQIVDRVISGGDYELLMPLVGCLIGVTVVMGILRFLFQAVFETASRDCFTICGIRCTGSFWRRILPSTIKSGREI